MWNLGSEGHLGARGGTSLLTDHGGHHLGNQPVSPSLAQETLVSWLLTSQEHGRSVISCRRPTSTNFTTAVAGVLGGGEVQRACSHPVSTSVSTLGEHRRRRLCIHPGTSVLRPGHAGQLTRQMRPGRWRASAEPPQDRLGSPRRMLQAEGLCPQGNSLRPSPIGMVSGGGPLEVVGS